LNDFSNYLLLMACDVSSLRLIVACLPTSDNVELACITNAFVFTARDSA
jgi:hypothetical protein